MIGNKRTGLYSFTPKEKPDFFKFVAIPHIDVSMLEGLQLYASTNGKIPTPNDFDLKSEPLWNGEEGIFSEGSQLKGETTILVIG